MIQLGIVSWVSRLFSFERGIERYSFIHNEFFFNIIWRCVLFSFNEFCLNIFGISISFVAGEISRDYHVGMINRAVLFNKQTVYHKKCTFLLIKLILVLKFKEEYLDKNELCEENVFFFSHRMATYTAFYKDQLRF